MVDMMMEPSNSLEAFLECTFKDVENKIKEMVSDDKILMILKGGKRLRPLLGSIAFKVCTGGDEESDKYQKFLEGCVGVELAHGASLVHDDIIDGDLNRRGEPAFYIKAGIDNAILIGHKMLTLGFDLAVAHGEKFAKLYVDSWRGTLDGQLKEINFNSNDLNDATISADSKFFQVYSRIIDLKTATLFSSSCKAAAIWADASKDLSNVLANYGREVGFAYQLADDLVDLEKGEMIDSVVLPLLARLEKKSIKNGTVKARRLKKKIENNSPKIKNLYLDEIKKHAMSAQRLSTEGIIPTNRYKTYLQEMPTYITNKMLKEINITL
ncbi:MAG: polyprenyl synthetase family protein [Thermoplasmatales archaeon]|nr:MAG: polyprenyl synthetase family protein [Thermoplasmatales archaeon]